MTDEAWRELVTLQPIGVVRGGRAESDDDFWGGVISTIELDSDRFGPDALAALDTFSHVVVIYHFHLVEQGTEERGGRRPRGREDWPVVGIFAQRAKRRPNRIGVSTCRLVGVDGTRLTVEGLDAMTGTPRTGPQAVHGRVRAQGRGVPARVVTRAYGGLLCRSG